LKPWVNVRGHKFFATLKGLRCLLRFPYLRRNPFRVATTSKSILCPRVVAKRGNPGLELANAFSVTPPESLNLRQRQLRFVQILSGGNPSLIDQRAFRLIGKFKIRELDAKVIDEDRAPFVTQICLQQNILDVQERVDDAAGKTPQAVDW